MLPFVLIVAGFALGIAVGRWWALPAALALGLLAGVMESEVSGWVTGVYVALPAAIGIAFGVATRRSLARRRRPARV